jgi:hypothetical protein
VKLLLCLKCKDVFNLNYALKKCSCGEVEGKYLDKLNATYKGENAVPIGFDNFSFADAIRNQPIEGMGERFTAFTIPKDCPTFKNSDFR